MVVMSGALCGAPSGAAKVVVSGALSGAPSGTVKVVAFEGEVWLFEELSQTLVGERVEAIEQMVCVIQHRGTDVVSVLTSCAMITRVDVVGQ